MCPTPTPLRHVVCPDPAAPDGRNCIDCNYFSPHAALNAKPSFDHLPRGCHYTTEPLCPQDHQSPAGRCTGCLWRNLRARHLYDQPHPNAPICCIYGASMHPKNTLRDLIDVTKHLDTIAIDIDPGNTPLS